MIDFNRGLCLMPIDFISVVVFLSASGLAAWLIISLTAKQLLFTGAIVLLALVIIGRYSE